MKQSKCSLYADYIKERCGDGIVETKEGFATFKYIDKNIVYIQDIYVTPKKRKSGLASDLANKICDLAIKDGRNILLGSVDEGARGSDVSAKVLEAYGMKYYKSSGPLHFFAKQISEIVKDVESEVQSAEGEVLDSLKAA